VDGALTPAILVVAPGGGGRSPEADAGRPGRGPGRSPQATAVITAETPRVMMMVLMR
jgi:hypothetical protein